MFKYQTFDEINRLQHKRNTFETGKYRNHKKNLQKTNFHLNIPKKLKFNSLINQKVINYENSVNQAKKTKKINNKETSSNMIRPIFPKQKLIHVNITIEDMLCIKKQEQRKDTDISFYQLIDNHYDEKDLDEMIREKTIAEAKVSKNQRKKWHDEERLLTGKHKLGLEYLNTSQLINEDRMEAKLPQIDKIWKKFSHRIPKFDKQEFEKKFQLFLSSKTCHITDMDAKLVIGLFLKWEEDCASFMTTVQKAIISSDVPLNLRKFILSYIELFYIQDLYLQVPSFMDTMLRFEQKYASQLEERYHYRMILKKRSIIFKIKLFIQKQLQQGKILNDGQSLLTEFKKLILGKQYHFVDEKKISQDDGVITITNWSDTKYALEIIGQKLKKQIEAFKLKDFFKPQLKIQLTIKQQKNQQSIEDKTQSKTKKKKKKLNTNFEVTEQEQQNKIFDELSQFLQKLQINNQERIQCRLDEDWIDRFSRKIHQQIKPKTKRENFKFKNFQNNQFKKD